MCCVSPCGLEYATRKQIEQRVAPYRASRKGKKPVVKNRPYWNQKLRLELQRWANMVRDAGKPCISCGAPRSSGRQFCGGHFLSVGAHPDLQHDPNNIHGQCNRYCNRGLSGNTANFERGLIDRYGQAFVDDLRAYKERPRQKPSLEELESRYRDVRQWNKDAGVR